MNTLNELLVHPVFQRLGWTLVHSIWQGAAIALLVAIVLAMLARRSSQSRYVVSCIGLLLMFAALVVTFLALPGPIVRHETKSRPPMTNVQSEGPTAVTLTAPLRDVMPAQAPTLAQRLQPLLPMCSALWIIGIAVLSVRHVGGWMRVQRLRSRANPLGGSDWDDLMRRVCEQLGVRRAVRLAESALVQVPSVIGYVKPVILLPVCAMSGLSPQQLEGILAHELAHVRRHDYLVNLLQIVIETLLFYHPAAWWLSKRIRQERENCCDDLAASVCGNRIAYVQALAAMEELRMVPGELVLAARGGSLLPRVRRLLGVQSPRQRSWSLTAAIVVVTVALVPLLVAQHKARADAKKQDDTALRNDDLIQVTLTDLVGPQIVTEKQCHLSADGEIDLPMVGKVNLNGQSPAQAERTIQAAYRTKQIAAKLPVTVSLIGRGDAESVAARYSETVDRKFPASPIRNEDLESKNAANANAIRANDVVQLSVTNLVGAGVETKSRLQVNAAGEVELPQAGQISLEGLSPGDAEVAIKKAYHDQKQLDVQVRLTPQQIRKFFTVEGAVQHPGHFKIENPDLHLADALKAAGELTDHGPNVYVRRISEGAKDGKYRTLQISLAALLAGDASQDILIHPNDIVTVPDRDGNVRPDRSLREVYVGGHVQRSGVYSLGDRPITLKQILIAAGIEPGDHDVRLVRLNPDDTRESRTVTFQDLVSGAVKDIALQVLDQIMVEAVASGAARPASQPTTSAIHAEDLVATTSEYTIAVGDLVQVSIMDLTANGVETVKSERVTERGEIPLPYLGRVKAAGLSASELEKAVAKGYADQHLIHNPQITASVLEARGRTFSIIGNVARPGQYAITENDFRLLDALTVAGGLTDSPESATVIRKEGDNDRPIVSPLKELTAGELKYNVVIRPRDTIVIGTPGKVPANPVAAASAILAAKAPPISPEMKQLLDKKLPDVNFQAIALGDVVDFLRDVTGANIAVAWKAIEASGLDKNTPVTVRAHDVSFGKALELVLDAASTNQVKIHYTVDENVVRIAPASNDDQVSRATLALAEPTPRTQAAPAAPVDPQTKALLEKKLPEVNFEAVAFSDVIDFLRDVTGANIFVNWNALEAAGIDRNSPVTLKLRNVVFGKVIDLLLDSVNGGTNTKLEYTVDRGVITISAEPASGKVATPNSDWNDARKSAIRARLLQAVADLRELKAQGVGDNNANVVRLKKLVDGLSSDLELATTAPTTQAAYKAIRIVAAPHKLTLEGVETTWDDAKKALLALPARGECVLEVAVASDEMTLKQHEDALAKGRVLANELKFKYLSDVGVQQLGTKAGEAPKAAPSTQQAKWDEPPDLSKGGGEYFVGGHVARPGVYSIHNQPIRLRQALSAAAIEPGKWTVSVLRKTSDHTEESVEVALDTDDAQKDSPATNIYVYPKDQIMVRKLEAPKTGVKVFPSPTTRAS